MLYNTRGIVIHNLKFSETSIIAKIYTELFGLQSYLIKGIRNQRSRLKNGLFQPLTLLDISVYHKEKTTLQHIREANNAYPYRTIPFDIRKSSITIFINEVIYKCIREEEPNKELFGFLEKTCITLDEMQDGFNHFHLHFLIRLTAFLGFTPHNNYSPETPVFDLREGYFTASEPGHTDFLSREESLLFSYLLPPPGQPQLGEERSLLPYSPAQRNLILSKIISYYRLHVPGFSGIQSIQVLHEVLS